MVLGSLHSDVSKRKLLMDDKNFRLKETQLQKSVNFWLKQRTGFSLKEQILGLVFGFDSRVMASTIITHIKKYKSKIADYDYMPIKQSQGWI